MAAALRLPHCACRTALSVNDDDRAAGVRPLTVPFRPERSQERQASRHSRDSRRPLGVRVIAASLSGMMTAPGAARPRSGPVVRGLASGRGRGGGAVRDRGQLLASIMGAPSTVWALATC